MERQSFAMPRTQRAERFSAPRMQRQNFAVQRPQRAERFSAPRVQRTERMAAGPNRVERMAARPNRAERIQTRAAERQQFRANRVQQVRNERQPLRMNRIEQAQNRGFERQQLRAGRMPQVQNRGMERQQLTANRIAAREQLGTNRQLNAENRIAARQQFQASRFAALNTGVRTRVLDPVVAESFIGAPVTRVATVAALAPLPPAISYLYQDTPDYYYRYGGGYLYEVDRGSNLIAALLPLLAGGYMPGSYLPNYYMNSYVPDYYGLNSFYPASYGAGYGYGYGYQNLCNRYANGVVYQVDCITGMVVDVIPLYAGGYGVGQMLPSSYANYNVPYQYRSLYYDTPDYNYWYAPGAIYQYEPRSSMITSVAALLSPGFTIGQPLPMGYSAYNVPYAYRATYYDTPNAWYRYNNGYIYQVDPTSLAVTAIVASLLT
jgi:hypothetical protein